MNLIFFQTDYHSFRGGHFPPTFQNFHIENVCCKKTGHGIRVEGHVDAPITDVHIHNVTIENATFPVEINEHDQVSLESVVIAGEHYSRGIQDSSME